MKKMNTAVYSHSGNDGLVAKIASKMRHKMYHILKELTSVEFLDAILDVGVTADTSRDDSNFFEYVYPHKERITALSNQDASCLEAIYKGLKFVKSDALQLPFEDCTFDLVCSSAVIEHVGSLENQKKMITECVRVSKKYVFITTPNRWHPIEFHTVLPLIHFLPKPLHRKLLHLLKYHELSQESNLNLLTTRQLRFLTGSIEGITVKIKSVRFLCFKSNLLLFIEKQAQD